MNHIQRTVSTKLIPKGWVKFNGNPAVRVTTKDCEYMADFIKDVKQELAPDLDSVSSLRIVVHLSKTSSSLSPGASIADALKNVRFQLT